MPRRNSFDKYPIWQQPGESVVPMPTAPTPLDLIPLAEPKKKRGREWEKRNRAWSYKIPRPLWDAAKQIRDDICAIAQVREDGKPREDSTTVNDVAAALMDWALCLAEQDPSFLTPLPNPHPRGRLMTLAYEEWDSQPMELPTPKRKSKSAGDKKDFYIAYRWPEELDRRIKVLVGKGPAVTNHKNDPLKYAVPVGEGVVKLLQRAIDDYKNGRMRLRSQASTVHQTVSGWEQPGSEGGRWGRK